MVGLSGLEPLTSRLSGVCSNHLSYKPVSRLAPRGPCLGGILLRFRLYALVKDSHLAVALLLAGLAANGVGHKRPLATQQQRRREGLSYFYMDRGVCRWTGNQSICSDLSL
jgi:hypothetical protein